MSDIVKCLKWMYAVTTGALLFAEFYFRSDSDDIHVTSSTWLLFAATAGIAALCVYTANRSHKNKLFLFGALAQHAGPLVRWSPFLAFALVLPTAGFLAAVIGAIGNSIYHLHSIGDLFHVGVVLNPRFWVTMLAVAFPTMGWGCCLREAPRYR